MKWNRLIKYTAGFAAGLAVMASGAVSALAEPLGLSVVEGQNIRSRSGGFEMTLPAEYEISRDGSGSLLGSMMAEGFSRQGAKIDFTAIVEDQQGDSYCLNIGVIGQEGEIEDQEAYFQSVEKEMEAEIANPAYRSFGRCAIAGQPYWFAKINVGGFMADSYRSVYGESMMTGLKEQGNLLSEMENEMHMSLYVCENTEKGYYFVQFYSGDMEPFANQFLSLAKPWAQAEGWVYNREAGWQYMSGDDQLLANAWAKDENGLTYHLDGTGRIQYNSWIDEGGRWKYVDELGHMVTSVTKTLDGVQYTFGADGYLIPGTERQERAYELGSLEGQTYINQWADIRMTFPEEAELRLGDGSEYTYALVGGEHVDVEDPELSYRVTLDFADADMELDRYLEWLSVEADWDDYQVDFSGTMEIGGYEYRVCRTSMIFSDGTSHHWDTYVRQIDDKIMEITINYYDELKAQADQVFGSIAKADKIGN